MMPMSGGDEHRVAALRLHGLAEADRRWILSRLADDDRIKLEEYLQELKGFALDPDTRAELEQRIAATLSEQRQVGMQFPSRALDRSVDQVLAGEPVWLARALRPESTEHRIGTGTSTLTPRARAAVGDALKRQVEALQEQRLVEDFSSSTVAGHVAQTETFLSRLRAAWRR